MDAGGRQMVEDVYSRLVGQIVQDVTFAEENSGIRLSNGSIGIYRSVDPQLLHKLVGQSITKVHEVAGPYLEVLFSGGETLRIPCHPDPYAGVESFCLSVAGGPIVVGRSNLTAQCTGRALTAARAADCER
jgi:hypothetical protein